MIKRVLVPLDGSDLAEGVLPYVEDLAKRLPVEVRFVQVIDLKPAVMMLEPGAEAIVDPAVVAEQLEEHTKEAETYLSGLAEGWRAKGITVAWEVLRGTPASSITDLAHSKSVDLIAMSTHGRSGLGRLVFGSVADQVLRESGTPLLLVKPTQKTPKRA